MKIMLDPGAILPTRAHDTDAGLDLYAVEDVIVPARGSAVFDTGVHIELPAGTYGKIESRSGLNVKHGVVSCGGVIDEGYTGSVRVKLYNMSAYDYGVRRWDKIAQLIVQPYLAPELELANTLTETDRGDAGFGSTGR